METTPFAFELIFTTPEGAMEEAAMVDALFEAGCGDAVLGFGQPGLIGLSFSREGADAETVIQRAVAEAFETLPDGSSLREVRLGIA